MRWPWVTIAETCELVMALLAAGDHARAVEVYSWLQQWRTSDGSYWTGYQLGEDLLWPDENPTWTAGAILLAADALTKHTAASDLFCSVRLLDERGTARERKTFLDAQNADLVEAIGTLAYMAYGLTTVGWLMYQPFWPSGAAGLIAALVTVRLKMPMLSSRSVVAAPPDTGRTPAPTLALAGHRKCGFHANSRT